MSSNYLSFKIVLLGDSVSKTTFVNRYRTQFLVENLKMTVGVEFYIKRFSVDGYNILLWLWDLNGKPRFRRVLPNYVKNADGGLFLYDVTDRSSIARVDEWLSVIRKGVVTKVLFPILVVGFLPNGRNKRDVSTEEGLKIANSRNLKGHIECNLKTGKNVEKVFEDITRLILLKSGLVKMP